MSRATLVWLHRLALAACLSATACGGMSTSDLGEQSVKLIEQLADIAERDKADCAKMGAELEQFVRDNEPLFRKVGEAAKKQSPEDRKKYDEKFKARSEAATKRMTEGLTACAGNAQVQGSLKLVSEASGTSSPKPEPKPPPLATGDATAAPTP